VGGQRIALIVANDKYDHEGLRNLAAPVADAEVLGRVLADPQIGNFAVRVACNKSSSEIQEQIEGLFTDSDPDDVLVLHFSCHGLKSESGELFFAAPNTRLDRLGSTAIPAHFVQRCMGHSRSRGIVLLLDCCYGGAFRQGVAVRASGNANVFDNFPRDNPDGGRGRAVITASNAVEYAFEGDQLSSSRSRPSVFTAALTEGLATGDADRDEDGFISLSELYDYVFEKVRAQNPHQTPSSDVQLQGELYIARSRKQRVRALPIPRELQAAIADTNMYTRLGAVRELQSRMASDNLPSAVGAYEALTELTHADIMYIADPAAEALRAVAIHPVPEELHFGRVEMGSVSPHRLVQMVGPPIARSCVPYPSHDWINAEQTPDGLDISVDTTRTGSLQGTVGLKGPTGEAVISITVHIVPPRLRPSPFRTHRSRSTQEADVAVRNRKKGKTESPPKVAKKAGSAVLSAQRHSGPLHVLRKKWKAVMAVAISFGLTSAAISLIVFKPTNVNVFSKTASVSASALNSVGPGGIYSRAINRVSGKFLRADGMTELLYIGAEYCPYCAADQWSLIVALSRFGAFSGLSIGYSAPSPEKYPNTATLSLYGSSYTSKYLTLDSVENENIEGALLEPATVQEKTIWKQYDSGSYPFIDIGNEYVATSLFDPQVLHNESPNNIASALSNPSSPIAQAVDGGANLLSAAICSATHDQPRSVCESPGIIAAKRDL
jgi:hypothetical protein